MQCYRRIALAGCLVTGGVSGHYSVTCNSLVLFLFYKIMIKILLELVVNIANAHVYMYLHATGTAQVRFLFFNPGISPVIYDQIE